MSLVQVIEWLNKDGTELSWHIPPDTLSVYSWKNWGKPQITFLRMAGPRSKIWTRNVPSKKQEH
jgi:hypothetical protein